MGSHLSGGELAWTGGGFEPKATRDVAARSQGNSQAVIVALTAVRYVVALASSPTPVPPARQESQLSTTLKSGVLAVPVSP